MDDRDARGLTGRSWQNTYAELSAADRQSPLGPADLERLALAAYLTGRDEDSASLLARAHHALLDHGEVARAARCAFWLASGLLPRGDRAHAAGWIARARRLLDEGQQDCVERGYLLLADARRSVAEGHAAAAEAGFAEAAAIGERFAEIDLVALARQGRGRALIQLGRMDEGVALLDEVMVTVTAGELSTAVAGIVYCSVVSACFDMLDMRRAHEWTDAFSQWCADDPDLVYRGECLVHRAEILRLHGSWPIALEEAQLACDRLAGRPGLGVAFYQIAELHRLRGDFAKAEDAYRLASEAGGAPHPGLALLRLAQGRCDAAKAAVCRLADEIHNRRTRPVVLAACVEILLAAGDVPGARRAAQELSTIAGSIGTAFLHAISAQAIGSVLLAEGDTRAALASLRTASTLWDDLQAPYEKARVGVLMGQACLVLGDADTSQLEIEAARKTFRQLGALPDLGRVDQLVESSGSASGCGLTPRELEVLRLVASGKTNRAIAVTLRISEKTVARHISNIFLKLDLPSRAAATAYAFQHHLV